MKFISLANRETYARVEDNVSQAIRCKSVACGITKKVAFSGLFVQTLAGNWLQKHVSRSTHGCFFWFNLVLTECQAMRWTPNQVDVMLSSRRNVRVSSVAVHEEPLHEGGRYM